MVSCARRPAPVRTRYVRIVSTQRTMEVDETSQYARAAGDAVYTFDIDVGLRRRRPGYYCAE